MASITGWQYSSNTNWELYEFGRKGINWMSFRNFSFIDFCRSSRSRNVIINDDCGEEVKKTNRNKTQKISMTENYEKFMRLFPSSCYWLFCLIEVGRDGREENQNFFSHKSYCWTRAMFCLYFVESWRLKKLDDEAEERKSIFLEKDRQLLWNCVYTLMKL